LITVVIVSVGLPFTSVKPETILVNVCVGFVPPVKLLIMFVIGVVGFVRPPVKL
jgi:hypothetical protein